MRNKQKEEDAKEELKRMIILGTLGNENTSKLPRTHKLNLNVKTIVDPTGYDAAYFPQRAYGEEYTKNKNNKLSRYDFK